MNNFPKMRRFAGICCLLIYFAAISFAQKPIKNLKPTVILISLDGFRASYLDKYQPPTLTKLANGGIRAKWMIPSFPSKTFPNHYTIVTGLYPEHHGIIENNIYDFGATFGISKKREVQNPRWWFGEPVWATAEKQGQRAGTYFYPGSDAVIAGVRPTFQRDYNGKVPNELRVDQLLSWLDQDAKRPTFLTLYFSDVDDAGHEFGPDAEETRYAVLNVDRQIARLMDGLRKRGIGEKVNIIITSDHGMANVDYRRKTFLDDYFNFDLADKILWTNEIVQIFPKANRLDEIYGKLKNLEHTTCWRKSEIPARFNYQDSPRIAPIVCLSEEGWLTTSRERYKDLTDDLDDLDRPRGAHGYDNSLESMRAIFIAHGQAFKKKKIVEPFENVNVYNVMTKILNLKPAPNDGNTKVAEEVLK